MIVCPNAKINLGLEVVARRPDGYHDIETLFVPVPELRDVLEVVKTDGPSELFQYGNPCDVAPQKNLCFKAYLAMKERYCIGNIKIYLYKNIPSGAGLGGGSSDAAFTLMAINEVFSLGLSKEELASVAATLGSDCPFFIYNRPMFASGRGEILEPFDIDLSNYRIEVVTPDVHISTAEAYAGVDTLKFSSAAPSFRPERDVNQKTPMSFRPERAARSGEIYPPEPLPLRLNKDISEWRESVINDFEAVAFEKYSILRDIKESLYERGAAYASMTGSGSALYGLFPK